MFRRVHRWLRAGGCADARRAAVRPPAEPVAPSTTGLVEGRVIRPSLQGEVPVPGVMVTLHRVGADSSGPIDSMRTDAAGPILASRSGAGEAPTRSTSPPSVYRGIAYFSTPLRAAVTREVDDAEIIVFDTTSAAGAVHGAGASLRRRRAASYRPARHRRGVRDLQRHRRHRGGTRLAHRRCGARRFRRARSASPRRPATSPRPRSRCAMGRSCCSRRSGPASSS